MIRSTRISRVVVAILLLVTSASSGAEPVEPTPEPVTLDNAVDPGPNRKDEPRAESFSLENAARFLDQASLTWQKKRQCFTCHTNYAYLYARPAISGSARAHKEVRRYAEELVWERWGKEEPRWDTEVVATAAALAFNDANTTGRLHPLSRMALDRMWTVQEEDGGWDWLQCGWPPMESDDHYGVTVAAIGAGVAPDGYAETEKARKGIAAIRRYLESHPPPTLHHEAMVLWASSYLDDLMDEAARKACVEKLLALQKADGGWGLATFYPWERSDDEEQDLETSDGYGTGFVLFVLRRAGVPVSSDPIQRGVRWLKENQRASGRWFTRSLKRDGKHFLTHAGTAMAVLALGACGEIPTGEDTAEDAESGK